MAFKEKNKRVRRKNEPSEPVEKKKKPFLKWAYIGVGVVIVIVLIGGYLLHAMSQGLNLEKPPVMPQDGVNLSVENYEGYTRKDKFYNFLIIGTDAGGLNTDTMLVVSFDTVNGQIALLQIPRDSILDVDRSNKRVNASYAIGGIEQLEKDLEGFLGIPIDRYGIVSITAFRNIVDAVGGVSIHVPQAMQYEDPVQNLIIDLKPGVQTLNGIEAEGFVRYRNDYADADIGRLKAQKAFISGFLKKLISFKTVFKIPELITTVSENLKTDLSVNDMIYLGGKAVDVGSENIKFFSLVGENYRIDGKACYAIYKEETMEIINSNFNPFEEPLTADKFKIMEFERKEETAVDVDGKDLEQAVGTELSPIKGQKKVESYSANPQAVPKAAPSAVSMVGQVVPNSAEAQSEGVKSVQAPLPSGQASAAQSKDSSDGTKSFGFSEIFEAEKPKVEIINSTKDGDILEAVTIKITQLGYEVIRGDTANNIEYTQSMIINRNEKGYGTDIGKEFASAKVKDEYQEDKTADVTMIIGSDLLK